jgi:hypothetical protein
VKGNYFQPITSNAPKITTTTEIDVASFKIGSFHEFECDSLSYHKESVVFFQELADSM